jgi:hypothetical protein
MTQLRRDCFRLLTRKGHPVNCRVSFSLAVVASFAGFVVAGALSRQISGSVSAPCRKPPARTPEFGRGH